MLIVIYLIALGKIPVKKKVQKSPLDSSRGLIPSTFLRSPVLGLGFLPFPEEVRDSHGCLVLRVVITVTYSMRTNLSNGSLSTKS